VGDGSSVGVGLISAVGETSSVGVGVSVVSEGVSVAEEVFWGSDAVRVEKSLALLSESSPFPPVGLLSPGFRSID